MAGLFPLSRMQQLDEDGVPLGGCRLFLYDGGTSSPRVGYRDLALSSAHPNPIVADSQGRLPLIYLDDGYYRQRLTKANGTLIFDDDGIPVLSTSAGGAGTSVDPNALFKTRDLKIRFDDQPLAGYVRLNGRSIGSAGSGATERANADTQSLYEELWGFANIAVSGGKGASAAADFAANKPLTLPDCAGRLFGAMDDLGAGAAGRLSEALVGSDPTECGAIGGTPSAAITQANLPSYTLTGGSGSVTASGTTGIESATHTHPLTDNGHEHATSTSALLAAVGAVTFQNGTGASVSALASAGSSALTGIETSNNGANISLGNASATHVHNVTVNGTASSVSISSGGSGTAFNKLPNLILFMIYIRL